MPPTLSSGGARSSSDTNSTAIVEYEVLYYQRKIKVHKSKGVSKMDGILRMEGATGSIRLQASDFDDDDNDTDDDDDDDSDDSDDDTHHLSKKKAFAQQMKKRQQKKRPKKKNSNNNTAAYSGQDKALVQRCCGTGTTSHPLQEDDILVLGGYEVQIVSCLTTAKPALPKQRPAAGGLKSTHTTLVRRKVVAKPLQSVKPSTKIGTKAPAGSSATTTTMRTNKTLPRKPLLTSSNTARQPLQKRPAGPLTSRTSTLIKKRPSSLQSSLHPAKKIVTKSSTPTAATTTPSMICPGINLPASIRTVLRPHQVHGVEFLWKALTPSTTTSKPSSQGCILADEMGLGKTLMTIATIMGMHRKNREKHFIVVCPSSLVSNWAKEFDKWAGKASQPKRVVLQKGDEQSISRLKSVYSSTKSMGGQVLILSYELFRRVTSNFKAAKIGLLIVDEGHRLKNQDGLTLAALESLSCDAKLCITATPIQNNLREFYNLASFVRPGVLGDANIFRKEFERPINAANQKNASREQKAKGKEQAMALDDLIKPFMLRRLQKDVLKSILPPRTEALLFCRPTSAQCRVYEKLCTEATSSSTNNEALVSLTNLRKLCGHPSLLNTTTSAATAADVSLSGKLIVLKSLLKSIRDNKEKVVIVSNFTSVLSLIESTILQPQQLPFARLDGSTDQSERQGLVDTFNRTNSSVFAFLLSSKAGGCGLNLIGASRLVMFDADWNPATDTQAAARIYRPGQTKPCYIYRMFTTGTVEEVILQRQIAKESLAVFDGTKNNQKFTTEELKDCFTLKDSECDTKHKLGKTWQDYNGAGSLEEQGSNDATLLETCENINDTLSFVHIVEEKENEKADGPGPASMLLDSDDDDESQSANEDDDSDDSSSDEEMEF